MAKKRTKNVNHTNVLVQEFMWAVPSFVLQLFVCKCQIYSLMPFKPRSRILGTGINFLCQASLCKQVRKQRNVQNKLTPNNLDYQFNIIRKLKCKSLSSFGICLLSSRS